MSSTDWQPVTPELDEAEPYGDMPSVLEAASVLDEMGRAFSARRLGGQEIHCEVVDDGKDGVKLTAKIIYEVL